MQDIGLISIIMAAYNAEKTINQAIDSVLAQTYTDWELVVVNDCSKDNTVAIIEAYHDPRIRLIQNPENKGASYTRHHGVLEAKGNWIAILDSDDAWTNDKLEKQVALQGKTNANLLYTASTFMDSNGNSIDWVLHAPLKIDYRQLLKQNLVSNSSVLVNKELYLKYEILGNNMHEDFACWLNFLKSGEFAYGVDEPLLIYRLSKNSKSGNKIKAAKMNWKTYRTVGLNIFEAAYYMVLYTVNGLKKYKNLK